MSEYIEREALLEEIEDMISNTAFSYPYQNEINIMVDGMERARDCVENAPAADVVDVKHAHWVGVHDGWGCCSNCHRMDGIDKLATHCRFCGAKMDGE